MDHDAILQTARLLMSSGGVHNLDQKRMRSLGEKESFCGTQEGLELIDIARQSLIAATRNGGQVVNENSIGSFLGYKNLF